MQSNTRKCTANLLHFGDKKVMSKRRKIRQLRYLMSLQNNRKGRNKYSKSNCQSNANVFRRCTPKLKLSKAIKHVPNNSLNAAQNSVQNAVPLFEGICFCDGLEPSTSARVISYNHFCSLFSACVGTSAFNIRKLFFVWTSTKSRHKLWFRTCLVCRKPR